MHKIILEKLTDIQKLMHSHQVEKAYVFGSAARNTMNLDSDVDFMVRFPADMDFESYGNNYFNLMYALQNLLGKDVEILAEETITNPYLLESINRDKISVYERWRKETAVGYLQFVLSIDEHLESRRIFEEYKSNKTKRRAVERELEIIGEGVKRLLLINPDVQISYARLIVDLRNKVIHAYDNVQWCSNLECDHKSSSGIKKRNWTINARTMREVLLFISR